MTPLLRLGLTGGIGSGKSTVARMLAERGAAVIDADAISRQLTAPGGQAMAAIAQTFGADFVRHDGALDRDKMRARVYSDSTARERLEAIIHPLVGQETRRQAVAAQTQRVPCLVFDIPLLVESGHWRQKLDHVLVIDCPPEIQIERVMTRSAMTRVEVERILATQAGREQRLRAADTVLFNANLSLAQLASQVLHMAQRFGLS